LAWRRKENILKLCLSLVAAAAVSLALIAPGLAGAVTTPTGNTDTIYMKEAKDALVFVAPKTITEGDELKVVNSTDPKKHGPHTFSLVTKASLPKTKGARQKCFTPKHICMAIADWHGVKGEGPVTKNPAKAGAAGWDTLGSISEEGDSWFTGKKGQSVEQIVGFDTATGPQSIYFLCAIHPWMQGSTTVLPSAG
jgi:hypothetical protein